MEAAHRFTNKGAAMGLKQRDGNIIVKALADIKAETIGNTVKANVTPDTLLMSDEGMKYIKVSKKTIKERLLITVRANG